MSENVSSLRDPSELRPLLHDEVERLDDGSLDLAHRALLEIELQQLGAELDDLADDARGSGRMTLASIAEGISKHRVSQPYQ